MKKFHLIRSALAMCIAFVCLVPPTVNVYSSESGNRDVVILHTWSGDYPVVQLVLLPEDQRAKATGFIKDADTFAAVWNAFKPDEEVPEIDFEQHLVLFARNTQFYNPIRIGRVLLSDGIAEIMAMETMSAMPIENKVSMSIAVMLKKDIMGIKAGEHVIVLPNH